MAKKNIHRFLKYWLMFFLMLLGIYLGIGLVDAFNGGEFFFRDWRLILVFVLPLCFLAYWGIDKNIEKGG